MSRCNSWITFSFCLFITAPAWAQRTRAPAQALTPAAASALPANGIPSSRGNLPPRKALRAPPERREINVSYLSWSEILTLTSATERDTATSTLFGTSLTFQRDSFFSMRTGMALEGGFMLGQGNAGGTQSNIVYQASSQKWWGLISQIHYFYRSSPQITYSIGPMAIYRSLQLPGAADGSTVESGASFNIGGSVALTAALTPRFSVKTSLGSLLYHASTFWSVGLGLRY